MDRGAAFIIEARCTRERGNEGGGKAERRAFEAPRWWNGEKLNASSHSRTGVPWWRPNTPCAPTRAAKILKRRIPAGVRGPRYKFSAILRPGLAWKRLVAETDRAPPPHLDSTTPFINQWASMRQVTVHLVTRGNVGRRRLAEDASEFFSDLKGMESERKIGKGDFWIWIKFLLMCLRYVDCGK